MRSYNSNLSQSELMSFQHSCESTIQSIMYNCIQSMLQSRKGTEYRLYHKRAWSCNCKTSVTKTICQRYGTGLHAFCSM